ncbi:MAG: hypothetical protein SGJ09_06515 [Phycisphaerae bacterium]|nr:hypothetical protein [Phycisphaerae bacterium]
MDRTTTLIRHFIAAAAALSTAGLAQAQVSELMHFDTYDLHENSGVRAGAGGALLDDAGTKRLDPVYWTTVRSDGANMLRVHLGAFELGASSELHITSLADGATQRFTHASLTEWSGWSAIFNGDTVLVQLLAAPNEAVSVNLDQVAVNAPVVMEAAEGGVATLCGGDNRTASTDSRVGRLSGANCGSGGGCGGCTAWLTSIGCALTAGHCGTASGGLIEFNVPQSSANGTPVAADPDDQYPVGLSYYAFQDADEGFDWAIMSVGANANTGLRAHWVQSYFHISAVIPSDGSTLRITGCGLDDSPVGSAPTTCCGWDANGNCTKNGCNSTSLTLQTATGDKTDDSTNRIFYAVDTEPANSGSPIIRESNGFAIGIHTNGGCSAVGGENSGTRLSQATLDDFLNDFLNAFGVGGTRFLDDAGTSGLPLGTALNPAMNLVSGLALTPSGGTLAIAGGSYSSAAGGNTGTFSTPVTLQAVSGVVTLGN